MKIAERMPILLEHKRENLVGQALAVEILNTINIEAEIFDTPSGQAVRAAMNSGFQYQASIGFEPIQVKYVGKDETYRANGKDHQGPLAVVTESELKETSCVIWGRDNSTSVSMSDEVEMEIKSMLPATLEELRAEFPEDAQFVFQCLDDRLTLSQAVAAKGKALRAELAAQQADLIAQRAELENFRLALKQEQLNVPAATDAVPVAATNEQQAAQMPAYFQSPSAKMFAFGRGAEPFSTQQDMEFYAKYGGRCRVIMEEAKAGPDWSEGLPL